MSHFTVAVFHKSNESIEDILEQYYENARIQFIPAVEAVRDEYDNNKTVDAYRLPNGRILPDLDPSLFVNISRLEYENAKGSPNFYEYYIYDSNDSVSQYKKFAPECFEACPYEARIQEVYPTIEDYVDSLEDDWEWEKNDEGVKGYWTNPHPKWDWYEIGGRWNGLLKLKDGASGTMGTNGVFGGFFGKEKVPSNRCSSARVGDIDFSPDKEEYDKAKRFWEVVVEGKPLKKGEDKNKFHSFYKPSYLIERYGDADGYAKKESSFSTYAVIQNGNWYEPGQMGWFGMSLSTTDDEINWDKNYYKFIEAADADDILTIVDCHI